MKQSPPAIEAIQPIGFHVGLSSDWMVTALSANIGDYLSASVPTSLGEPLTSLLSAETIHDIRNRMALLRSDDAIEHLFHCQLVGQDQRFDISLYRDGTGFGLDAEACAGPAFGDATGIIEGMLVRLDAGSDVETLCSATARQLRALTGYDSVSVHVRDILQGRSARPNAQTGDSDIPPPISSCMITDRDAAPVPIVPADVWQTKKARSGLQAPGTAELDWMTAVNARSTLVLPLSTEGKVWGQVSCIHATPRRLCVERRSIARLFASFAALRIEIAELRSGLNRDA